MDDFKVMFAELGALIPKSENVGNLWVLFLKAGENGLEKESEKTLKSPNFVSKMLRVRRFFCSHPQRGHANPKYKVCHCDECRLLD